MEITVVLVTCDRAEQMRVALESLLAQQLDSRWSFEVLVVDDGSSDNTQAVLQEALSTEALSTFTVPMRVLSTKGIGVPGARNLGARAAAGRWMACFDDDQIASPGWLQALRETAEKTGSRCVGGALALKMPEGEGTDLMPRVRALLGEHLLSGRVKRYGRKHLPASNNVLIERDLFFALGGFDERFTGGGSDTDLFLRVRDSGEDMWFAPEALAHHVIPPHRLRPEYLRWTSLKVGAASARILNKRRGLLLRLGAVAVRGATTLLRDLPELCRAKATGSATLLVETRCSLWYTQGLLRGLAAACAPKVSGGERFLDGLDFRQHGGEREALPGPRSTTQTGAV